MENLEEPSLDEYLRAFSIGDKTLLKQYRDDTQFSGRALIEFRKLFVEIMDVLHERRLKGSFPPELWETINDIDQVFTNRIPGRAEGYGRKD